MRVTKDKLKKKAFAAVVLVAVMALPAVAQSPYMNRPSQPGRANSQVTKPVKAAPRTPRAAPLTIQQQIKQQAIEKQQQDQQRAQEAQHQKTHGRGLQEQFRYNSERYPPSYPGPDGKLPEPGSYYPYGYYNDGYYNNGYYNGNNYYDGYNNNQDFYYKDGYRYETSPRPGNIYHQPGGR